MDILKPFSIPIKGLKNGVHEFDFHIGKSFFEQFEGSPIKEGQFDVHLNLEKRHDMLELNFDFSGTVPTECDRCLSPIHLPVSDNQDLLVKFSIVPMPEDAEVVYISPEAGEINVAKYIYEFISLSMPYINRYDCENDEKPPCDFDMLKHLAAEEQRNGGETGSIWDHIKDQFKES